MFSVLEVLDLLEVLTPAYPCLPLYTFVFPCIPFLHDPYRLPILFIFFLKNSLIFSANTY